MSASRRARLLVLALVAGALAAMASLSTGVGAAATLPPASGCLLNLICQPSTTTPTTKATTATSATTTAKAPPTTLHQSVPTTVAKKPVATATPRQPTGVASVGVAGLPLTGAATGIPALGADPAAAPQLAVTPSATTSTLVLFPAPKVVSGLVGATGGLPSDHATLRIALSILALLVAGLAMAQLPPSRRAPRRAVVVSPDPDPAP